MFIPGIVAAAANGAGGVTPITDISTATHIQTVDLGNNVQNCIFDPTGTIMWSQNVVSDILEEWDLTTPWDASTATKSGVQLDYSSEATASFTFSIKPDGTKIYLYSDTTNAKIYQYGLSTAWDLSTASYDSVSATCVDGVTVTLTQCTKVADNGLLGYQAEYQDDLIYFYDLSPAFDISGFGSGENGNSFDPTTQVANPTRCFMTNDGKNLFIWDSKVIYQYDMSTPFDETTLSYSGNSLDLGANIGGTPNEMWVDPTNAYAFFTDISANHAWYSL